MTSFAKAHTIKVIKPELLWMHSASPVPPPSLPQTCGPTCPASGLDNLSDSSNARAPTSSPQVKALSPPSIAESHSISCENLDKSLNFSEPQFLHL